MAPEESEHALAQTLAIATTAAQLAAGLALAMTEGGAVHPTHAQHFAKLSRHLGELFQANGDDEMAGDFGAIAARLQAHRKGPATDPG